MPLLSRSVVESPQSSVHVKLKTFLRCLHSLNIGQSSCGFQTNVCELMGHLPEGSLHLHNSWCHTNRAWDRCLFPVPTTEQRAHCIYSTLIPYVMKKQTCSYFSIWTLHLHSFTSIVFGRGSFPGQLTVQFNTYFARCICRETSTNFQSDVKAKSSAVNYLLLSQLHWCWLAVHECFPWKMTQCLTVYHCQS